MPDKTKLSAAMIELLERSNMTADNLPDTEEECNDELALLSAEIHDIKKELQLYEDGEIERPDGWRVRATDALRYKQSEYTAFKRWRNGFVNERQQASKYSDKEKHRAAIERLRAHMDRTVEGYRRKVSRMHLHADRSKHVLNAARQWIAENAPEHSEALFAVIVQAQEEFDRAKSVAILGDMA